MLCCGVLTIMPPGEPALATYRETRFDAKRVLELFGDHVRIRGSSLLGTDFDTTIALGQLQPRVTTLRVRNRAWGSGLLMASLSFFGWAILVLQFELEWSSFAPVLCAGLCIAGLLLVLATARKVEFARFEFSAGVPLLDIARSGADAGTFDEFVDRLLQQIRGQAGPEA